MTQGHNSFSYRFLDEIGKKKMSFKISICSHVRKEKVRSINK